MRTVIPERLWIGNAGDLSEPIIRAEPEDLAIVDLAIDEPVHPTFRDRLYLRIPLIDGSENSPERLRLAVRTVAALLLDQVPICLACSSGMSRSPAIAAYAMALVQKRKPEECLSMIREACGGDVMPVLWNDIADALAAEHVERSS
ncbi:MAG: protein phosphatase [Planctomycetaceae bacterium]